MRIVVIEDEERSRKGLARMIQDVGPEFRVIGQAANGVEGLALIRDQLPDVAFVDVSMPVMDGLEMIERALLDPLCKCTFVIISAYSKFEYVRRALRSNVADYILKPVIPDEVERTLFKLLGRVVPSPFLQGNVEEIYPMPEDVHPLVRKAADIVREEYASPLSLDGVASRLCVSNEYLSQLFSRQMNVPFTRYLKQRRVDVAKRLLLEGKWRIQDVSSMTGYQNARYFVRVFKEIADMTPSEYQRYYTNKK